jgi:hypothetical protein
MQSAFIVAAADPGPVGTPTGEEVGRVAGLEDGVTTELPVQPAAAVSVATARPSANGPRRRPVIAVGEAPRSPRR